MLFQKTSKALYNKSRKEVVYIKLFTVFFAALLLGGCSLSDSMDTGGTTSQIPVEVLSVIDGDTIRILYDGKETTVRYLLIDTPETNHPRLGEQPLGKEATERNKELIQSGEVSIEFDVGDRFDDYSRLLAYLYVDGESIQEELLASGYARVAYVFPPNTRYLDDFEQAEQLAKDDHLGIWEFENYATDRGFDSDAFDENDSGSSVPASDDCDIKGNINRSGDKIYHLPGTPSYAQTNPEEWFCSEQDARDSGFRSAGE